MIEFVYKAGNKNLIIFIHGLTGSNETWENKETENTFPDLLLTDETIHSNFDIAYFEYFSSFLNMKEKMGMMKSLFSKDKSSPKNISINEISQLLTTFIDYELLDYDSIILVGHSMGGLIAKRTILKNINRNSKIKLFLSLAVPHLGSELASYSNFVTENIQVKELRPLSDETISLWEEWIRGYNLPITKYFTGVYEGTVNKNSSVPPNTSEEDILHIDENHRSISKPRDTNSIVIKSTLVILKEFLKNVKVDDINYDFIVDEEYDDEYFVLKLLIADVHQSIVKNSKKHFYYSESIRKIFTSKQDLLILQELYAKIESIYFNTYGLFISKKITSSVELVSMVHEKILENEEELLKTRLSKINGLHKQGMIHQLANDINRDISWSDPIPTIEELNELRDINV